LENTLIVDKTQEVQIELKHWSHSQDQSFRECLRKWYLRTVVGLEQKRKSDALHRGLAIHYGLEQFHTLDVPDRSLDVLEYHFSEYYATQRDIIADEADYPEEALTTFDAWHDNEGLRTVKQLWDSFGQDEGIPALTLTEFTAEVPIPGTAVKYQYRLDALVLNTETPFIFETKSMGKDNRKGYDMYDLQAPRNVWAVNMTLQEEQGDSYVPIHHLMYNFIVWPGKRTGVRLERRTTTPSAPMQLAAVSDLGLIIEEALRPNLVIYPNWRGTWCRNCDFFAICEADYEGRDRDEIIDQKYTIREKPTGAIIHEVSN
tara:strand:- start:4091 stop:5038 length:948 start_codon:yes stop_codon:yes gene_type:complete